MHVYTVTNHVVCRGLVSQHLSRVRDDGIGIAEGELLYARLIAMVCAQTAAFVADAVPLSTVEIAEAFEH